jgi:hypothetical protein
MITFKSNNMNKRQHTLFLFLSLGILVFAACKKEGRPARRDPQEQPGHRDRQVQLALKDLLEQQMLFIPGGQVDLHGPPM